MPVTYADLRQRLEQSREKLVSQIEDTQQGVQEEGVGYSNHMADAGTEVFEQARDVTLSRQLKNSLGDVEHALDKFEDGTFGLCESCGAPIDLARLEAVPEARRCLACQSRREGPRSEARR
jgi:DnaK suppressor protein